MSTDLSRLSSHRELWKEWRFEPWENGSASGLYRRLTLIKSGLLGEVARYYVDDYIVWKYEDGDFDRILRRAKAGKDLMTQRYVFLQEKGENTLKRSSFLFGFRGFLELHRYSLYTEAPKDIEDIAYLVNKAGEAAE